MYKCYSVNLLKFLMSKDIEPAHFTYDKKTGNRVWLFYQTAKFKNYLAEYRYQKEQMKKNQLI